MIQELRAWAFGGAKGDKQKLPVKTEQEPMIEDLYRPQSKISTALALAEPTTVEPITESSANKQPLQVSASPQLSAPPTFLFEGEQSTSEKAELPPALSQQSLTAGEPFGATTAAHIEKVLGVPVSKAGLTKMYQDCFPGAKTAVTGVRAFDDNTIDFVVSWQNNEGEQIGHLERRFHRHPDDSLEMHRFNFWVDPEHRGKGVSQKVIQKEIGMLKGLSDHPNTRMTFRAGYANIRGRSGAETQAGHLCLVQPTAFSSLPISARVVPPN